MALTRNGTAVANATLNSYILNAVAVNGKNVWTFTAPSTTGWVSKTGAFIKMTSNSAPSPFSASVENSYGAYSTSSTNYWYAFDNNAGNSLTLECQKPSGSTQNAYVGVKCSFGKTIRVKTMTFDGISGWGTRGIQLRNGTSVVYEVTDSNIGSSTTFTVPSAECDSVVIYVRQTVQGNGSSITCNKFQITSWEEKVTWTNKTGTLASSSVSGEFNPWSLTDDVCKTQTVNLSSPTKATSVYLYCGTRRVDNGGWCNGRVTLTGKTSSGSTVTLLDKYTDFDRNGKTVTLNNTSELVSVTWTWYTPDSTWRDYNVNQNGYISAWQIQE